MLIEYYIFRISQFLLVLSTFPKKFLYFTRKRSKPDSLIYSIFETNLSVPLVKFPQFFHVFRRNLWILLQFYVFISQSQKFCIYLLCLKLISTYRVFIFYSCNFHMRYVARIFLNLIQVCKRFVLKLWAIEIVFLQARGNHLKKVFLGKLLNHHWSLRELFLLNLSENGTFV